MANKYKKKIITSLVLLILSLAVLTTVIFGWFSATLTPSISAVDISVVNKNYLVEIAVNADGFGDNEVYLQNVYPGKEYNFTVTLINYDEAGTANYSIYFNGLSDNINEELNLDMVGIFKFQVGESAYYFRERITGGKVAVTSGTLPVKTGEAAEPVTVNIKLIFSDYYMNDDLTLTNDADVINSFQRVIFIIRELVVAVE